MLLAPVIIAILLAGSVLGYVESIVGRAVIDSFAPTLIELLDAAAATPGAEEAPGLLALLWGAKTAIAMRAFIWSIVGIIQVIALGSAGYAFMKARFG